MFKFENIEYLYALTAIPIFVLLYILSRILRRQKLKNAGEKHLLMQLMPQVSDFKPIFKFIMLLFAYTFGVITLANPQIGTKMEEVKREGVELIIALDVSNSMKAEDIKPNRLTSVGLRLVMLDRVLLGALVFKFCVVCLGDTNSRLKLPKVPVRESWDGREQKAL